MIIPSAEKCSTCGAALPANAAPGQCVRCSLELALLSGGSGEIPALPTSPLRYFGDYQLVREIARGGMGVIWRARQVSLNRMVAVKVLLEGQFASEAAVKRFEFEAEAAASLDHPNIVPIYEVGQQEGWPFISMKLIEGQNLAQAMQARRTWTLQQIAEMISKIARAVHFAHSRGILHRDLKPSNILLDHAGEPHITDFGIARTVGADGRLTQTGALLGSPYYMAPEQASSKSTQLTVSANVYSLGVLLFELLTGELPFQAETPLGTLKLAAEGEPASPRALNSEIDRDLETICLKCLDKSPEGRYESAAALAIDLERWLKHEPVLARPAGKLERTVKWLRRHPVRAVMGVAAAVALLIPLLSAFYMYHFVLPKAARAHPIVGIDPALCGFLIDFETGRVDRASMNFDPIEFGRRKRKGMINFTNLPPNFLRWSSKLKMQVFADIPAAPDLPRGPVVSTGEWFPVEAPDRRDRAYYICPYGWQGEQIVNAAPKARLILTISEGELWKEGNR